MQKVVAQLARPLLSAAVLGMLLGSLGYVGLFFWKNREMCPCAPVGLVDSAQAQIAAPLTREGLRMGMVTSALGGGAAGILAAIVFVLPSAYRLGRLMDDDEPDKVGTEV